MCLISFVAAIGGLLVGFNIMIIAGAMRSGAANFPILLAIPSPQDWYRTGTFVLSAGYTLAFIAVSVVLMPDNEGGIIPVQMEVSWSYRAGPCV